ncbi:uncharacterized protein MONBRDRAFT_23195 [Monosiga brevicollis MX1]|uniref:2'-phosphotransferase n=1 Tax=Monosiga brevicollis TaxID=81824 RepID=A9URG5_MONBE|nr:uncharacterized protein MONBRDRAFT_23195 [Monosiga brevicollis MX1]EDQ92240.1 predicted protein [Monosiga brevicollis MX1]|eukprot:XP_001743526.1 hypothetical protein [Monosiga brevicollis MX1]
MTYLLRHGAEKEGVPMSKDGFVHTADLRRHDKLRHLDDDTVREIVATDAKGRFELREGPLRVRATQGHSLNVQEDSLLDPVLSAADWPVVVHGTYHAAWAQIQREGLRTMGRQHIHFSTAEPGSREVISGMRTTCNVWIYLDLDQVLRDGIPVFISRNRVLLTAGQDGVLHPRYFKRVVRKPS